MKKRTDRGEEEEEENAGEMGEEEGAVVGAERGRTRPPLIIVCVFPSSALQCE